MKISKFVSTVLSYKPADQKKSDLSKEERECFNQGFKALHVRTKTGQSSNGYYQLIISIFKNHGVQYFLAVVARLESEYKGYQMPTRKEFRHVLAGIKRDEATERRLDARRGIEHKKPTKEEVEADRAYFGGLLDQFCDDNNLERGAR